MDFVLAYGNNFVLSNYFGYGLSIVLTLITYFALYRVSCMMTYYVEVLSTIYDGLSKVFSINSNDFMHSVVLPSLLYPFVSLSYMIILPSF